ncbi:outer membrane receptor for ferrienterochelin and colicins [Ketogulonicigenium robustum]|uniref:Outer membrane receptor for ferrienterochelin and colicins n=1 Tax=Ketogulonicigenium robustum TaxID=92947 RepID=A0A1W6P1U3_9RHOB|nr:TonB-dependent receptor [Ketogulonicigenium robustum]ARO15300.1 outer membrane receptor for ferrienterochelin and colicins [Ketogulonicigenium robustum]
MSSSFFSKSSISAALLCGAALVPGWAVAQDAGRVLNTIVISSASGVETTLQDAPASVTVIDSATIAASGARDLNDMLRTVPGLNLTRGNDGNSSVSFRGLPSSRTLTLVNGRRVNTGETFARHYQGNLGTVPLDAIDRIEVVRGPMSTLYGSDAMGGVVNVILKEPTEAWTGSVTTEYATASEDTTGDSRQISAYFSGRVSETLSAAFWGKVYDRDAGRAFSYVAPNGTTGTVSSADGSRVNELGARLTWTPTANTEWGLELTANEDRYKVFDGHDTNRVRAYGIALTNEWSLGSGNLSSYLRYEDSSNTPWNSTANAWNDATEYGTTTFETRYTNETELFGNRTEYTLGLTASHEKLHDTNTNSNGVLIEGSLTTAALYAEARYHMTDALTLTYGLRADNDDDYGTNLTPRVYANYDFGNGLMLKAGFAQAFNAPDLRSLNPNYSMASRGNGCKPYPGPCQIIGNPDLEPETSDSYEIGLNYQGADLSWEVTAFYNDVTNMFGAQKTGETNANGFAIFQRTNIDEGRTGGIEGGLSWAFTPDLTWSNSFTYLAVSEFKYEFLDHAFPMATTPKLNITTGLDWQATDALTLGGSVTYVGKQVGYVTEEELSATEARAVPPGQNSDPYFLVDLTASYLVNDTVSVNFGIDNVFDQQPDDTVSYRENGRLFRIGVTTQF